MITNAQLARQIEQKLNPEILRSVEDGQGGTINEYCAGSINNRPFAFKVHSNNGEYQAFMADGTQKNRSTVLVNAVLGEQISTPLPLQGLGSVQINQTLSFIIPIDLDLRSGSADYALQAINLFVQDVAGLAGTIEDSDNNKYAYVLSVSTPFVGQEAYTVGTQSGRCVPATCQVVWQFIKDGVVGNNINMTLDGAPITLLDGAITRTRVGDAVNIDGSPEMQTTITQQGILVRIVTPYKSNTVTVGGEEVDNPSKVLYNDMLRGSLTKTYTLVYSDDVVEDLELTVVAKEISVATTAGKGVILTATFVPARE